MTLLGLDGCKDGKWVVAKSDHRMRNVTFAVCTTEDVITATPSRDTIAVLDVPIGLSRKPRECDEAARRLLAPIRHNSVFRPPCPEACKQAYTAPKDYNAANELSCATTQVGISRQVFGIAPRIWEVNVLMTPAHQRTIREGHPEVSLALMNGCPTLPHHKARPERTTGGRLALPRARTGTSISTGMIGVLTLGGVNANDIIDPGGVSCGPPAQIPKS